MRRSLGIAVAAAGLLAGCAGEDAPPAGRSTAAASAPAVPGFELVDVSRQAGLAGIRLVGGDEQVDHIISSVGTGAAWLDYDGDGDADLYLAQGALPSAPEHGPPDILLRNDGDGDGDGVPSFTDVTREAGLGDESWSFGVAVADYDNDGDPDIYLTNWGKNRLYRNEGDGRFRDIAPAAGVDHDGWGVTAAWSDTDRDGDLDLYVANYVEFSFERYPARGRPLPDGRPPCMWRGVEVFCGPRNLVAQRDVFYRNDGDPDGDGIPRFSERTVEAGLATETPYYSLGALFFDADGDGDDDLYVANDSVQNAFFVNRGDGTFFENATLAGLAFNEQGDEQASMGISAGDYDRDGLLDLVVTNFSHDHDTVYRNEGGGLFTDVSYPSGVGAPSYLKLGWGIEFVDLDQDGFEDLFVAEGHVYPQVDQKDVGTTFRQQNSLYRNLRDGTFEPIQDRAGSGLAPVKASRAVVPVDLDDDGDLDLLLTSLNDSPDLLRNDGAAGHWLEVRLTGRRSNRDGIGARITIEAGGARQIREIRRTLGLTSSTLPVAHFGLGPATRVDRLQVRWTSGSIMERVGVEADRLLELVEDE